jgi:DNA-binding NtrC family response regulator
MRPPTPVLIQVLAAARPCEGTVRHALLGTDEVHLGRETGVGRSVEHGVRLLQVRVSDPFASRLHARMIRAGDRWVLEDASSKNGVHVDGKPSRRRWLEDGDVFEVGETFFLFRTLALSAAEPSDLVVTPASGLAPGLATVRPDLADEFARLARIAGSCLPVLLRGETGTGKEVVARAYHQLSNRAGPLVAVNCGALPPALIESNLFGHLRSAFTGAVSDRVGLIASADGGTLFLDEIAELPLSSQAALLRVIQHREVLPLGATRPVGLDVRIVAATHHDLGVRAHAGTFRDDLLARLVGYQLELPPLRARREDLGLLVAALWQGSREGRAKGLSIEAARALFHHPWPHNVRELEQALIAARSLASEVIELRDLPADVQASATWTSAPPLSPEDDARREQLCALLALHRGNVSVVARALHTSRAQMHRLCDRFGLVAASYRRPG